MAKANDNFTPILFGGFLLAALMRKKIQRSVSDNENKAPQPHFKLIWPIDEKHVHRVGQSVLNDRDGHGTPHHGIDIMADSKTPVRAARQGKVIRVTDGRLSDSQARQKAGLWVDIEVNEDDGSKPVYRYLHLGDALVKAGELVSQGSVIGSIAAAHTSGLGAEPHLHFEIRSSDYTNLRQGYGLPIDPLTLLPPRRKA